MKKRSWYIAAWMAAAALSSGAAGWSQTPPPAKLAASAQLIPAAQLTSPKQLAHPTQLTHPAQKDPGAAKTSTRTRVSRAGAAPNPDLLPPPAPLLLQEIHAIRTLSWLKLSPHQLRAAAAWIQRASRLQNGTSASGDMLSRTRRVLSLLQQDRDGLAAGRPLSDSLLDELTAEQAAQAEWMDHRETYLQNAAQALLETLTPDQKNVLTAAPATPAQVEASRQLLQQAVEAVPTGYSDLTTSIQQKYPKGAPQLIPVLEESRSMKALDLARGLDSLALKMAETMARTAPVPPSSQTDPALAGVLSTLLHYPAIQWTILRAAQSSDPGQKSTSAPTTDDPEILDSLQRTRTSLQQQIQALILFSALGFTRAQAQAALPSLQQADEIRQRASDPAHDILAALSTAIRKASDTVVQGQEPSLETDGNPLELTIAVQIQQQSIRRRLQLAAFSMLNNLPTGQLAQFAASEQPLQVYDRVMNTLNAVRAASLPDYLTGETTFARQVLPQAGPEATETRLRDLFRQARLMTDAEFQSKEGQLVHTLVQIVQPPAPPTPAVASGKPQTPDQLRSRASLGLLTLLDIPGLSTILPTKTPG